MSASPSAQRRRHPDTQYESSPGTLDRLALLRNPLSRLACFGKTRVSARTRVMRPQRRRGVTTPTMTAGHERPREEWIEISVPALVTEESFARARSFSTRTNYDCS